MFYLMTHSTHFIYGYMASDIWLRTILIAREETRCCYIGYSFQLTARVILYASSHRQDNTYNSLCYTSHGALAGTRNSTRLSWAYMPINWGGGGGKVGRCPLEIFVLINVLLLQKIVTNMFIKKRTDTPHHTHTPHTPPPPPPHPRRILVRIRPWSVHRMISF